MDHNPSATPNTTDSARSGRTPDDFMDPGSRGPWTNPLDVLAQLRERSKVKRWGEMDPEERDSWVEMLWWCIPRSDEHPVPEGADPHWYDAGGGAL